MDLITKKSNMSINRIFTFSGLFFGLIFAVIATSWCVNLYKLTQCDFQAPWKGEIIHAVGLIPIAAPVTVWNNGK